MVLGGTQSKTRTQGSGLIPFEGALIASRGFTKLYYLQLIMYRFQIRGEHSQDF